jgi:hypothetical protein
MPDIFPKVKRRAVKADVVTEIASADSGTSGFALL